jgi:hypothetical protein
MRVRRIEFILDVPKTRCAQQSDTVRSEYKFLQIILARLSDIGDHHVNRDGPAISLHR